MLNLHFAVKKLHLTNVAEGIKVKAEKVETIICIFAGH
jgi:hypothetical protein